MIKNLVYQINYTKWLKRSVTQILEWSWNTIDCGRPDCNLRRLLVRFLCFHRIPDYECRESVDQCVAVNPQKSIEVIKTVKEELK